jgi:hypothetical protein
MAFLGLHSGSAPDPSAPAAPLAPQHYHHPSPREIRAHAVHRLQIGLLGLSGMLLLVGLANIIMERARDNDDAAAQATVTSDPASTAAPAIAAQTPGSDPLADMGVVPDLPSPGEAPGAAASGAPASQPRNR